MAFGSKKVTTVGFAEMKRRGEKIAMLTAYDHTMARILDSAGVDGILVGDSLANVVAGHATTIPATMEQMIYHASYVARGVERALVVCDMPFGSYEVSKEEAVRNAARIMKETGVDAVKLEGGTCFADTVRAIVDAGIPVMGHIGLIPQSVKQLGGYGVVGAAPEVAGRMKEDAAALCQAGCFAVTIEKAPAALAAEITSALPIPTIGIGAGSGTDGQILVVNDMLGMDGRFHPKFVRKYAELEQTISGAAGHYVADVKAADFPSEAESY